MMNGEFTKQDMYDAAVMLVNKGLAQPYEVAIALAVMETESGFTSGQFKKCGTAGMVAPPGSKAPYYGWNSRHFLTKPVGIVAIPNRREGTLLNYIKVADAETGLFAVVSRLRDFDKVHQWNSEPGKARSYNDTVYSIFTNRTWPTIVSLLNLKQ